MNSVEKLVGSFPLSWPNDIIKEFEKPYFSRLIELLSTEKKNHAIYPNKKDIFNAFKLTPYSKVKVVIIGQDPYHGPGQANGLAFSVNKGISQPPSLKNIFKELTRDLNIVKPTHGNLKNWATQGVLLINSTLTVRAGNPNSHQHFGWSCFTDAIIQYLSKKRTGIVFLLWGNFAIRKKEIIDETKHHILTSPHPSPFSAHRGFIGSNHFSETNLILKRNQLSPINWEIS